MPATALTTVDTREVVRCTPCKLVQFRTSNSRCRRCHTPLTTGTTAPAPPVPEKVVVMPIPLPGELGVNLRGVLRERRLSLGYNQKKFGQRAGFLRTYIFKIEKKGLVPNFFTLQRYAQGLRTRGSSLVARAENPTTLLAPPLKHLDETILGHIGPTIRMFREKVHMSRGSIQEAIMMEPHYLCRLEKGHLIPRLLFFERFAPAVNQTPSTIIAAIENAAFPNG